MWNDVSVTYGVSWGRCWWFSHPWSSWVLLSSRTSEACPRGSRPHWSSTPFPARTGSPWLWSVLCLCAMGCWSRSETWSGCSESSQSLTRADDPQALRQQEDICFISNVITVQPVITIRIHVCEGNANGEAFFNLILDCYVCLTVLGLAGAVVWLD